MACGAEMCAAEFFPDPSSRSNGGGRRAVNDDALRRQTRRARFFSRRLDRVTELIQQPTSISLREFALLLFALFALYRGYFAVDLAYTALARRNVGRVCMNTTAMQCLRKHLWELAYIAGNWAAELGKWFIPIALVVFFAEETFFKARQLLLEK